jgi:hypothetical protein
MSETMELPLEEASAGQVLASDLRDAGGMVLLPRGTELTESMLGSLARRGVATLAIVAEQLSAQDEAAREQQRQQRLYRLERLFRRHGGAEESPLLACLRHYRRSQ